MKRQRKELMYYGFKLELNPNYHTTNRDKSDKFYWFSAPTYSKTFLQPFITPSLAALIAPTESIALWSFISDSTKPSK